MKNRHLNLFALLALLFLAAAVFTYHFARQRAKTTGDLAQTEGQIDSYSFLDDSRGTHHYEIQLSGFAATFEIPAEFSKYFALTRFASNLKKGDSLSITIPAQDATNLTSVKSISVFGARTKTATYLAEYDALNAYNGIINKKNKLPALISFGLLSIGLAFSILAIVSAFMIWKARTVYAPAEIIDENSQRLQRCLPIPMQNSAPKPGEMPTCPVCGAPAEKTYLYGADSTPTQEAAGNPDANERSETAAGDQESQPKPYAEVLRCSSCKRIILEYGRTADTALEQTGA